ncbi:MAG TPA: oligosaccharide flippase family protein [Terriglobales bacterium]|nr:oligosaccharide flippase family protein [Terriglobales bacterium]
MMVSTPEPLAAAPPPLWRNLWQLAVSALRSDHAHVRILSGSMIMLLGSVGVSGVNFVYNMVTARLLGPTDFGHITVAVTLLMFASAITLAFQLLCAKFVARNESLASKKKVISDLHKKSWLVSTLVALGLVLSSSALTRYLHLPYRSIVLFLALGVWFYIPLGVRRGAIQGMCAFPRLASNFMLEVGVKFVGAVVFIELLLHTGLGPAVMGAIAAITLSVIAAYFLPPLTPHLRGREPRNLAQVCTPASAQEGIQAIVFFIGQVLITNTDMIMVKHFFAPREAGLYAAVALVGRVLYFVSWSLVSAMFPVTANAHKQDANFSVLAIPLGLVLLISGSFVAITFFIPHLIMRLVFGAAFHMPSEGLLSLYAAATGVYALSVVLIAFEMSRKIANTAWLQLLFSGLIVAGIYFFHSDLQEVVMVQMVLMSLMLVIVSLPFVRVHLRQVTRFVDERRAA